MARRVLDHNWPWQAGALVAFVLVMATIRYILVGFNEDFGYGFGLGCVLGLVIALTSVGWRRGEMR
jgi:hypothetical protein